MTTTFSAAVLRKGQALLDAGAVYATGAPGLFTIVSSSGNGYVVTVEGGGAYATCTCAHGRHHPSASCSHVAAVLLSMREDAQPLPRVP